MLFEYRCLDQTGIGRDGLITARAEGVAREALRRRGWTVLDVAAVPEPERRSSITTVRRLPESRPHEPPPGLRVSNPALVRATRQLAAMLTAGVPLEAALRFVGEGHDERLGTVVADVHRHVVGGAMLSTALERHPQVFSPVYVGLVRVGEKSGGLVLVFEHLAELLERSLARSQMIVAALTYPAFVVTASLLAFSGFIVFVLPALEGFFSTLNLELPLPTRMVLALSRALRNPFVIAQVVVVPLVYLVCRPRLKEWTEGSGLRQRFDALALATPLLGRVLVQLEAARALWALKVMLETGIPAFQCLEILPAVAGNSVLADRYRAVGESLVQGDTLSEALAQHRALPPLALHLIRAGEASSRLPELMARAAEFLEEEARSALETLTTLLEPVILVGLGVTSAFLFLAALLPTVHLLGQF